MSTFHSNRFVSWSQFYPREFWFSFYSGFCTNPEYPLVLRVSTGDIVTVALDMITHPFSFASRLYHVTDRSRVGCQHSFRV